MATAFESDPNNLAECGVTYDFDSSDNLISINVYSNLQPSWVLSGGFATYEGDPDNVYCFKCDVQPCSDLDEYKTISYVGDIAPITLAKAENNTFYFPSKWGDFGLYDPSDNALYDISSYQYAESSILDIADAFIFIPKDGSGNEMLTDCGNIASILESDTIAAEAYDAVIHQCFPDCSGLRMNLLTVPTSLSTDFPIMDASSNPDGLDSFPTLDTEGFHVQQTTCGSAIDRYGILHIHIYNQFNETFSNINVCGICADGIFAVTSSTPLKKPILNEDGYIIGFDSSSNALPGKIGWRLSTTEDIYARRIALRDYAGNWPDGSDNLLRTDSLAAGAIVSDYIYDSSNNHSDHYILDKKNCGYYGEDVVIGGKTITIGYVRVLISDESIAPSIMTLTQPRWVVVTDETDQATMLSNMSSCNINSESETESNNEKIRLQYLLTCLIKNSAPWQAINKVRCQLNRA